MKFGVFDHMDDGGVPLSQQFEARMKLAEAYDRFGFHAYHLAEHHGTPLGLAPSPGLFMAALAQRTKRLRFGPLVYLLPLYHPLRLIEEICMLDHMSGGRLELGVGRGVSPIEVGFFGVDPAQGPRQFPEALRVIKQGLTSDLLTFEGEFYRCKDVPMILRPLQKPHPPLWYGVATPEASVWAARERASIAMRLPAPVARTIADRFRAEWTAVGQPQDPSPRTAACHRRGLRRHGGARPPVHLRADRSLGCELLHLRHFFRRHHPCGGDTDRGAAGARGDAGVCGVDYGSTRRRTVDLCRV